MMRVEILPIAILGALLFALASAQTCGDCRGSIPAARACVEGCNSTCFDDDLDPDEIVECCGFNETCVESLEFAQDCFDDCLDECLPETSAEYALCIAENNGMDGCNKEVCDAIKAEEEASGGLVDESQVQSDLDEAQNQIDQAEDQVSDIESEIDELGKRSAWL